ncbi:hypothetical protein PMZ80_008316 [Knufia obscura]|uniref:DUF1308 domain-containing protein n=1 Tax=Knufia obscura TaxID=1635080 RepID=A0ABR0REG4_9EURO|nr:hypothetical protein PMZ80_008316 [Knufia obscura]
MPSIQPTISSASHDTMDTDILDLYQHLSDQARTLLNELEAFNQHITSKSHAQRPDIHINKFRADVAREAKQLEHHGSTLTAATDDPETMPDGNTVHQIRSSNITHLNYIWDEVKCNEGVTGIRKQVRYTLTPRLPASAENIVSSKQSNNARQRSKIYYDREARAQRDGGAFAVPRSDKEHVTVDIFADHGAKWIKVFTKNQGWLMMDLAKEGLVDFADESESDMDVDGEDARRDQSPRSTSGNSHDEALEELKLVKMAKEFLAAAKTTRVGQYHRHPKVHFHLPKIERGVTPDVDAVISYIGQLGVVVSTADQLQSRGQQDVELPVTRPKSNLQATFDRITTPPPSVQLTEALNIDCTLLIALISDISHLSKSSIMIPSHYDGRESKKDIEGQMASEEVDALLPKHIYPVLRGKKLVCTEEAAAHLRNIVRIMGSERETRRSKILLGSSEVGDEGSANVTREMNSLSIHRLPDDIMLPIHIVKAGGDGIEPMPDKPTPLDAEVMSRIAKQPRLSSLNRSVFLHGWGEGLTTISLNRVVSEWLDRAVDTALDQIESETGSDSDIAVEGGFVGPRVLVCGRERSLLGNEKRGNHSRAEEA